MAAHNDSFSPSAQKPAAVVQRWQARGFPLRIIAPPPVSEADLCRAHEPTYVREVLAARRSNGFGNRSPAVAASLPYTSGAMLAAAREAIRTRAVAAAPCSGFHHAGYASGGGYCTFNGLMVTACALRAEGAAARVGILDCDMHYGDGTVDIIEQLRAADWTRHYTAGAFFHSPDQAADFLTQLPELVRSFKDCSVLLYQAGADPHIADPLGGWLTDAQLRERDCIVFAEARRLGIPIAWNLAGGYQRDASGGIEPVLAIHAATFEECARAYDAHP